MIAVSGTYEAASAAAVPVAVELLLLRYCCSRLIDGFAAAVMEGRPKMLMADRSFRW